MSAAISSVRESIQAVARGLRVWGFYLVLLLSLIVWVLAYQYKTTYSVDLGGLGDDAYVSGFHAKEHNADLNYRWSDSVSSVRFPGVGNQPIELTIDTIGFRPSGDPPTITVKARGRAITLQTHKEPHSDAFTLPAGDRWQGDLVLTVKSPTFTPPGDPRALGVIVDKVTIRPASPALTAIVTPSVDTIASMLLALALLYIGAIVALRRPLYALLVIISLSGLATALIIYARPELGLLAPNLPSLSLWALLLSIVGRAILDTLLSGRPNTQLATRNSQLATSLATAAFVLAFLLRFGGLIYPQFLTSDLNLHIHNVLKILAGQWVFPGFLPDGTTVPYPPALYVLVAPLTWLFGSADETTGLILKWTASSTDAATCLALAWASARLWSARGGGIAALVYALSPAPFDLFSAGNYSNLFAQGVLNLTLLGGLVFLVDDGRRTMDDGPSQSAARRPSPIVLLTLGFFLTVFGHYGMMLATLALMALFAGWTLLTARRVRVAASWWLVGAFGIALVGSFALYYWRFTTEMRNQLTGVLARVGGQGTATTPSRGIGTIFRRLGEKVGLLVGFGALLAGAFGAALTGRANLAVRGLLFAWLAASTIFALLDQALGDAIRWYYLAAAAIALLAGRYLALLLLRRRAANLLVTLSLLTMLAHLLWFWVGDLIFVRYH